MIRSEEPIMHCKTSPHPTTEIDVGEPPYRQGQGWQVFSFKFHDFANLPATKDASTSPVYFNCFDRNWSFHIHPGGRSNAHPNGGTQGERMAYGLHLLAGSNMNMKFVSYLSKSHRRSVDPSKRDPETHKIIAGEGHEATFQGHSRERILAAPEKFLLDGTLTINLCLKQADEGGGGTIGRVCHTFQKIHAAKPFSVNSWMKSLLISYLM